MKFILTQILILTATLSFSQKITGIWRGYFVNNTHFHLRSGQFVEDKYKYEVQINDLPDNSIQGVTYSYKDVNEFYGKAAIQGIFNKKGKSLIIKETKMLELKTNDQSTACLMTCYLEYKKSANGSKETLTGTFSGVSEFGGSPCSDGTVYLEKKTTTDFTKEDFLLKKISPKRKSAKPLTIKPTATQNLIKPGAEDFMVTSALKKKIPTTNNKEEKDSSNGITLPTTPTVELNKDTSMPLPVPDVLLKRENVLTQTFIVDSEDVTVEFYDNGQIDGDTISVYHNNQRIVNSKRLTYMPIVMQAHIEKDTPNYEFIVVAENLGAVPPNTALVVISSGSKHYEINIASDEQRNAKIVLKYQKAPDKK